jgi:Stage II sporulation protein E (SpoIIE)
MPLVRLCAGAISDDRPYLDTQAGGRRARTSRVIGDGLWGKQQLESLLRSCSDRTPAEIIRRILDEVTAFANGRPQMDDVTEVIASVNNEAAL